MSGDRELDVRHRPKLPSAHDRLREARILRKRGQVQRGRLEIWAAMLEALDESGCRDDQEDER